MREQLFLTSDDPSDYEYTKTCTDVDTINDDEEFKEVLDAFHELEIPDNERDGLFSVVAAILELGNVTFKETRGDECVVDESSARHLEAAARALKVDAKTLGHSLVTRILTVRNEKTTCTLDTKQASDSRHALCKFAYGRMFDWLVDRINKSMSTGKGKASRLYIGVSASFVYYVDCHP